VRTLRLLPAVVLLTTGVIMAGGSSAASASSPSTCSSGDLTGTYESSLTITGVCYVVNGSSVTVDGNLTVTQDAMLDAISPCGSALLGSALPGNLTVTGNIDVKRNGALLLGWCTEPNQGYGYENCDASKLGSADDHVGGSLTSVGALAVIVHNVQVSGGISLSGGGGGVKCATPTLFAEDSDPAVNGSQSVGYDFSPLNYSDLESNTVGKSVHVTGLSSCWFGALRDAVAHNFVFTHNTMSSSDGNEVVGNEIAGHMGCKDNSPAVQFGDSGASPNVVSGTATGECASPISEKP
jgi:hypothetical protein